MLETATTSKPIARLGHAWGGPTWLLHRPDGRVVVRVAFDQAEREQDASGLDEVLGWLRQDGALVVTSTDHAIKALAWGAKDDKGRRVWTYRPGDTHDSHRVWRRRP